MKKFIQAGVCLSSAWPNVMCITNAQFYRRLLYTRCCRGSWETLHLDHCGNMPLIDSAGTEHRPAPHARILSLVPSLTELLFDLGLDGQVVGRTAFCVHPAGRVQSARSVGGTKAIDMEKVRQLAPTHVIVNIDETPRALASELGAAGLAVVVTHPIEVSDNLDVFRLFGALFGREREAEALCDRLEAAFREAAQAAREQPPRRVLYLIWKEPWMTVARDTYISRMLALLGLHTVPLLSTERYPIVDLSDDLLASVDHVLFSSEPFPFKDRHAAEFRERFPRHAAKAVAIDGQMVSWYGSRSILGLSYLAQFRRGLGLPPASDPLF